MKIYLIDDNVQKVCFLNQILTDLNKKGASGNVAFEDGFRSKWSIDSLTPENTQGFEREIDNVLCDAEFLVDSLEDDGVFLIDLNLPSDCHIETGKSILQRFIDSEDSAVTTTTDEILNMLPSHNYYQLAAVLLAICKNKNRRCFTISTYVAADLVVELTNFGFKPLAFPEVGRTNNSERIEKVVEEIWTTSRPNLDLKEFVERISELSHPNIDQDGGADSLLRRFLRLEDDDFDKHFCMPDERQLRGEVKDALKTIAGLDDGRKLCFNGAWLLALGKHREHFPNHEWKEVFLETALDCGKPISNQFPPLHPAQKPDTRKETIRIFGEMCDKLFVKRHNRQECTLTKVTLEPDALSFVFNFVCNEETGISLSDRIALEGRNARGESVPETGHDTSESIWRLWVSCSFSDQLNNVEGVFGVQPRMNLYPRDNATEIRFEWPQQILT